LAIDSLGLLGARPTMTWFSFFSPISLNIHMLTVYYIIKIVWYKVNSKKMSVRSILLHIARNPAVSGLNTQKTPWNVKF